MYDARALDNELGDLMAGLDGPPSVSDVTRLKDAVLRLAGVVKEINTHLRNIGLVKGL